MKNLITTQTMNKNIVSVFTLLIMTVFLFLSTSTTAEAKLLNSSKNRVAAEKWCKNHIRTTQQDCKVVDAKNKCPRGYNKAKKFGGFIKGTANKACIKGGVAKKHSPSYVLMCRGGGRMVAFVPVKGGNIEVHGIKKARVGATSRKPAKGECAFMDRGLSAAEPSQLLFKNKKPALLNVKVYPGKVDSMFQGGFNKVLYAIRGSSYFYVHVKNNRGWFEVTRVGL